MSFENPERLLVWILLALAGLIVFAVARSALAPKSEAPRAYAGSDPHRAAMTDVIDTIARRVVGQFPTLDDAELARRVRDELVLGKMKNVDLYEASIHAAVARLRARNGEVDRWTD